MIVLGIDPGLKGALAIYNTNSGRIEAVYNLPVYTKNKRTRFDEHGILKLIGGLAAWGVDLGAVEQIGIRKAQQGAATTGYGAGLLVMACIFHRIRLERIAAAAWKKTMLVGSDKAECLQRALDIFPNDRDVIAGGKAKREIRPDRGEACLIAKFCGDHIR